MKRSEQKRIWENDYDIERQQEDYENHIGYLLQISEECDEMREAFGHDGHRSMLMTGQERSTVDAVERERAAE